jgi:formylmethanofuran dehydrogenase subunit E
VAGSLHGVRGQRVRGNNHQRYKKCDRCGRDVIRDKERRDGLVLCGGCTHDTWFIQTAGRTVTG